MPHTLHGFCVFSSPLFLSGKVVRDSLQMRLNGLPQGTPATITTSKETAMKDLNPNARYPKDMRSINQQVNDARYFFADTNLPDIALDDPSPYADKDGLVQFIVAGEYLENPLVMNQLKANKTNLVSLTSIVTDYINRYAAAYGAAYKTDIRLWEYALSKLPLMGPSAITEQTYSRESLGISISKDFIEFIMSVVVSQGTTALSAFQTFLEKQGEAIEMGISENKDTYNSIVLGVTSEAFKLGNDVIFTPKIEQYRISFSRENFTFNGCCTKAQKVSVNFDYKHSVHVFDYEALLDEGVKKEFDAFIQGSRKAQIENSSTFFNEDFPPENTF